MAELKFGNEVVSGASETLDAGIVGLLSFDIHYQKGPAGTDTEYS